MSEVEEIMKRVSSHKGVTGAIIIDKEVDDPITFNRRNMQSEMLAE